MILDNGQSVYIFPQKSGKLIFRNESLGLAEAFEIRKLDGIVKCYFGVAKVVKDKEIHQYLFKNGIENMELPYLAFCDSSLVLLVAITTMLATAIILDTEDDTLEVGSMIMVSKTIIERAPNGFEYVWQSKFWK